MAVRAQGLVASTTTDFSYAAPTLSPVTAVVPVKALGRAKSRLALPEHQRRALALAFAADTLAAVTGCADVAAVLVVTADADIAALALELGARVLPDHTQSLDAAVAAGVEFAVQDHPDGGVLVVPADLPCLRPSDVSEVLRQADPFPVAFVTDREGSGTTMVLARAGEAVLTRYGVGSAQRHTSLGLRSLPDAPARSRHDVDTLADLHDAVELGLGARTIALLGQWRVDQWSVDQWSVDQWRGSGGAHVGEVPEGEA